MANPCDYNFVRICAENLDVKKGKVYEFGSFRIENQNEFNNFRPFFPNSKFIGTDIVPGNGVDEIMDICNTGLPDESVDIAISTNVIEHLENPFEALTEMFRILKKDGMLILTSVMKEHIHNWPRDFWRFTPECFKYLLKDYAVQFVTASGDPAFPSIIAGVAWKSNAKIPSNFLTAIEQWKRDYRYPRMSFGLHVKRFVPPIITDYYDKNLYKPLWRLKRKILNKFRSI